MSSHDEAVVPGPGQQESPQEADTDNMRVVLQDIGQMIVDRMEFVYDGGGPAVQAEYRIVAANIVGESLTNEHPAVEGNPSSRPERIVSVDAVEEGPTYEIRTSRPRRSVQSNRSVEEIIIVPDATQQSPITPRRKRIK